jgi:hypothetical protein
MKTVKTCFRAIALSVLLFGSSAFAQFSGYFGGYYAPANWSSRVYGNSLYESTAFVYTGGAPGSLEIDGAVNSQGQVGTPNPPASTIDYTIVLPGSGLQLVTFNYSFTGLADGYDSASIIYNGTVVASLSTLMNGTQQTYFNNTTFFANGVNTFGFRVNSNNDSLADALIISAVPEPSAFSLLGLGAAALLWIRRRR